MAAPKNNNYHLFRQKAGRNKAFSTPKQLEEAWANYFQWVDQNPWYRHEAVKSGVGVGQIIPIPVKRPYTESGFCAYHGLGKNYLNQLRKSLEGKEDEESEAFSGVISWAENICDTDKFEGAVVGAYNANIISRNLGLKETARHELTGADGKPIQTQELSSIDYDQLPDDVLKAIIQARKEKGGQDE